MRTGLYRVLSACFAFWFAFALAEPVLAMHDCPVHDGVSSASAHHAAHHSSSKTASHKCSCLGECAGCALFALPSIGSSSTLAAVTVSNANDITLDMRYVPAWMHHVLPFQNGPPIA
jgi:hypothetical protein